jgi:hypothetical protein
MSIGSVANGHRSTCVQHRTTITVSEMKVIACGSTVLKDSQLTDNARDALHLMVGIVILHA